MVRSCGSRIFLLYGPPVTLGPLSFGKIVPQLTREGYGVIVPEMLGYGGTDKPTGLAAYSRGRICHSMAEILTTEGVGKVIILGHDWVSTSIHS